MSAHIVTTEIWCDTPGCWSRIGGYGLADARTKAKDNGWVRVGNSDVCPKCADRV